ncbi:astacin [Oesophagostomum dentatum]|uniref:Zinc metalloproteinase n=1 Tax=Oesophagostomum dentatum TaxID=61180 RepID=A0A0B1TSR6_OESDE|nr:astacin [Oesophagostomum dentatum]
MLHAKKFLIYMVLLSELFFGAVGLSAKARKSLMQTLRGGTVEERQARLQRLGALYFGNKTLLVEASRLHLASSAQNVASESTSTDGITDPSIEEINQREGVAEYLFQGDISLTDDQLEWIERSIRSDKSQRQKRQVDSGARLWPGNRVFYFFDISMGSVVSLKFSQSPPPFNKILLDSRKRSIVKEALNYIRSRTCLEFTESTTATNRIRVFSGAGCFATIGMAGGVQELSLGSGCEMIGIAAHEFAHALGIWHMQMRNDRDNFVKVDLSSVPLSMLHNYIKLPSSRIINYTPYEYGSYMHYDARSFATSGNSLIPVDSSYLRTIGSRVISFYDIKTINDHYKCRSRCGSGSAVCFNSGEPNPRNCAVCNCPSGYGGALCNQRPSGCGETLKATDRWQEKRFTFGDASVRAVRDAFAECNHWIEAGYDKGLTPQYFLRVILQAPAGKRVQLRVTTLQNSQCHNGCTLNAIEPKTRVDKTVTNPRICCNESLNQTLTSSLNPTPVISYNRFSTSTFTFQYRYI